MGLGSQPWSSAGLLTFAALFACAALAPLIAPFGQTEVVGDPWSSWSTQFWLGTDNLGRDMLSRLLYATRKTVVIALVVTALSFCIGVVLAFLAAVTGGLLDQVISRSVDVLMSIPQIIFALVVLAGLGTSIPVLVGVMAVREATVFFRITRPLAVDVMALDYVEVARLRGERFWWFLQREIAPNVMPTLATEAGLRFSFVVLFLSALSFLGLGIQPPNADLGSMVRENVAVITFGLLTPLVPAAVIALLTLSTNAAIDWFVEHHALRPRER